MAKSPTTKVRLSEVKAARKKDALALAYLIYGIFKEEQRSGKLINGQNNAKQQPK